MRKQTNWDRTRHRMLLRHYFEDVDYSRLRKALPPDDDDADADGYDDRERDDDNDELEADENGETKPSPDLDDEHDDDTEHDDIAEPALPPQLEQAIAALIVANPTLTRQQVAFYLLHHPHGRAMISLLAKQKGQPMDRTTELRKIAKQYGVHKLAGLLVTENKSHGITEAELTSLIFEEAKKHMQPGERPNSAFARYYSAPEKIELRKAIAVAKNTPAPLMSVEPVQVGGNDALDVNDASKAYQQLVDLAAEQVRRSPTLTDAQAFARVFEDPANATLANAAHRRPSATTSYEFPR